MANVGYELGSMAYRAVLLDPVMSEPQFYTYEDIQMLNENMRGLSKAELDQVSGGYVGWYPRSLMNRLSVDAPSPSPQILPGGNIVYPRGEPRPPYNGPIIWGW